MVRLSSAVHEVIPGLLQLYEELVVLLPNETPDEIADDPKNDVLHDCIGTIDGTQMLYRGVRHHLKENE
jgi:predicted Zn-dependent protease with MMP-like domain